MATTAPDFQPQISQQQHQSSLQQQPRVEQPVAPSQSQPQQQSPSPLQRPVAQPQSQQRPQSHQPQLQPQSQKKDELAQESIFHIELDKITSNPDQPRRHFDQDALHELANSIREFGFLQPIVVSQNKKRVSERRRCRIPDHCR